MSGASTPGPAPAAGGRWDDVARDAARRSGDVAPAEAARLRQLLCFTVAGSPYAIPVESVREIVRMRPLTPIPRVTRTVRGVISLRGEILQVVDLRLRLGLPAVEHGRATRIVVVHADDGRVAGVLVDAVREVLRVADDAIEAAPAGEASGLVQALCARGEEFVSLLDLERVLELDGAPVELDGDA